MIPIITEIDSIVKKKEFMIHMNKMHFLLQNTIISNIVHTGRVPQIWKMFEEDFFINTQYNQIAKSKGNFKFKTYYRAINNLIGKKEINLITVYQEIYEIDPELTASNHCSIIDNILNLNMIIEDIHFKCLLFVQISVHIQLMITLEQICLECEAKIRKKDGHILDATEMNDLRQMAYEQAIFVKIYNELQTPGIDIIETLDELVSSLKENQFNPNYTNQFIALQQKLNPALMRAYQEKSVSIIYLNMARKLAMENKPYLFDEFYSHLVDIAGSIINRPSNINQDHIILIKNLKQSLS